jgi:hypothetical protein
MAKKRKARTDASGDGIGGATAAAAFVPPAKRRSRAAAAEPRPRLEKPVLNPSIGQNEPLEKAIHASLGIDPSARSQSGASGHTVGEQSDRLLAVLRWGDNNEVDTSALKNLILKFTEVGVTACAEFINRVHEWSASTPPAPQAVESTRSYKSTLRSEVIIWAFTVAIAVAKIGGRSAVMCQGREKLRNLVAPEVAQKLWNLATAHTVSASARRGLSALWLAIRQYDPRSLLSRKQDRPCQTLPGNNSPGWRQPGRGRRPVSRGSRARHLAPSHPTAGSIDRGGIAE